MDDRRHNAEARLAELEAAVRTLAQRLDALETAAPGDSPPSVVRGDCPPSPGSGVRRHADPGSAAEAARPAGAGDSDRHGSDLAGVLSLVGRTLVVLGGAYLLRALTDAALWTPAIGVSLGFAYAAAWLIVADRTAASSRASATFHGLTVSIVALPLLWETVTRFQLFGGAPASALLSLVWLAIGVAAVRNRLQTLAWIVVLGALVESVALTAATGSVLAFAIADIALGVATLWIGYTVDWVFLRWPPALVADLAVLALAAGVSTHAMAAAPESILACEVVLLVGYLGSVAVRTLVRGRDANAFEVLQSAAALAIGFGGAIYVTQATGRGVAALGAIGVVCGAAAYAAAFAFVARRQGIRRNFYFYSSLALVLVIAGTTLLLGQPSLVWAALACVCSWTAYRTGRAALALHAAVYVAAAAIASGLAAAATTALVGAPVAQSPFSPGFVAVFAAAACCWLIPTSSDVSEAGAFVRLPRLVLAIILAWCISAWLVVAVTSGLAEPGLTATVRTGALAAVALALAWAGRRPRFREAGWLVYPVLITGGIKLLAEDLPRSRPATMFLALAFYGAALIAAPRIAHRRSGPANP